MPDRPSARPHALRENHVYGLAIAERRMLGREGEAERALVLSDANR